MPIEANVLLQAVLFRLGATDVDSSFNAGLNSNSGIMRDSCGCLISFTHVGTVNYVALAHYTVKEFLYSDRIAHSSVSKFALSDSLVATTVGSTVLEIITKLGFRFAKHYEPDPNSLYFFCILAEALKNYRSHFWSFVKQTPELGTLIRTFEDLTTENKNAFARQNYLAARSKVLRLERQAIQNYTSAESGWI